ncbi:hypothetical protein ACP4OV_024525 [Aristida adscensionis]
MLCSNKLVTNVIRPQKGLCAATYIITKFPTKDHAVIFSHGKDEEGIEVIGPTGRRGKFVPQWHIPTISLEEKDLQTIRGQFCNFILREVLKNSEKYYEAASHMAWGL